MNLETRTRAYIAKAMAAASEQERIKVTTDWLRKDIIAPKIVADFIKRIGDPAGTKVLDVGFGNGITAAAFAAAGAEVSGLDVSKDLLAFAQEVIREKGIEVELKLYNGVQFPFDDNTFDYAYSVSVLEHTSNPQAVLSEVARVMKPGGKFYLAFPNRLNPRETHTGLWLISYLPPRAASWIAQRFGRSPFEDYWNLRFISYFGLVRMLRRGHVPFVVEFDRSGSGARGMLKRTLAFLGIHHSALLPHVMVVLTKKK